MNISLGFKHVFKTKWNITMGMPRVKNQFHSLIWGDLTPRTSITNSIRTLSVERQTQAGYVEVCARRRHLWLLPAHVCFEYISMTFCLCVQNQCYMWRKTEDTNGLSCGELQADVHRNVNGTFLEKLIDVDRFDYSRTEEICMWLPQRQGQLARNKLGWWAPTLYPTILPYHACISSRTCRQFGATTKATVPFLIVLLFILLDSCKQLKNLFRISS